MAEIIRFPGSGTGSDRSKRRRDEAKRRAAGRTLCDRGFHKWAVDGNTRFDTQRGRLVTVVRCQRCDATRGELR